MAARHTVIQRDTAIQKLKTKQHRNNITQITSPQTWQMNSKSVLWVVWHWRQRYRLHFIVNICQSPNGGNNNNGVIINKIKRITWVVFEILLFAYYKQSTKTYKVRPKRLLYYNIHTNYLEVGTEKLNATTWRNLRSCIPVCRLCDFNWCLYRFTTRDYLI